jgi:hypothetical protein
MRAKLFALAGVAAVFLVASGRAYADSGTFAGSITPTDCGDPNDLYVDVDATHAFDFALAGAPGGSAC